MHNYDIFFSIFAFVIFNEIDALCPFLNQIVTGFTSISQKITCKLDLSASINNHKIKQKVIKMSHFAICHAKSEIKSNEGTLGTPALNPHWHEL